MANYTAAEKMKLIEAARRGEFGLYHVPHHIPNQLYSHPLDAYPSLSWGFLLYAVRHHMHRASQTDMARMLGPTVRQEHISRMERGKMVVPQTIRTWLACYILQRLDDSKEEFRPVEAMQPNRNLRQREQMQAHGTFGGAGKRRTHAA